MSTPSNTVAQSPIEVPSRSVSPLVARPALNTAGQGKQRSSSVNSVSSCHSTHHRSMSMASLESPRNSIVSIDDNFLRPTRNNSNASLVSLGVASSPSDALKDSSSNKLARSLALTKTACAVFSDEENSEPEHVGHRTISWRRRSSDKIQKPDFLSTFKKNFKFKYDTHVKHKAHSMNPSTKYTDDQVPSPLSLGMEGSTNSVGSSFSTDDNDASSSSGRSSAQNNSKKLRSSSMTQSIFLKRKFLLSKDIQFELLAGHSSPPTPYPVASAEGRHPVALNPHTLAGRGSSYSQNTSQYDEVIPGTSVSSKSPSPPPTSPPLGSPRSEHSSRQQNKLIHELNRKWNRALFTTHHEDLEFNASTSDLSLHRKHISRKRGRSESSSSTDSLTTNV